MSAQFQQRLAFLASAEVEASLKQIGRGIEKECLRVTPQGRLASTEHPAKLGAALTHSSITTDYSEALLEFITPVYHDVDSALADLDQLHRYTYQVIDENSELLWCASMPCVLKGDDSIPVGRYGNSNNGKMKTVYREGLGHRYGKAMQTIAGIHYNFSMPEEFWQLLHAREQSSLSLQDFKTKNYLGLIRNFHRYSWMLVYLFGASPALCKTFVGGVAGNLEEFDPGTFYAPYGTSLRMGDLGYQSSAQEDLSVCYNSLEGYIRPLLQALTTAHRDYSAIGIKNEGGDYLQLSPNLLQIENEFYSSIRPKRVTQPGETPINALYERGVEYIEVRCLDLDPYEPLGMSAAQLKFVDIFLMACLMAESEDMSKREFHTSAANLKLVVNEGRRPGLQLNFCGECKVLKDWGLELLEEMTVIAEHFDNVFGSSDYSDALKRQQQKFLDASKTPSARILADMTAQKIPYFRFAMNQSESLRQQFLAEPLAAQEYEKFLRQARFSVDKMVEIEAQEQQPFDQFLKDYYQQYNHLAAI
ncbi:Glutamate--cysteine ligase [Sinobacterium norvegicum]|uniref:Glutamate--cysteine ligase n=1 Tax=Sinobacterium norvegicum TaxID=1641715 RepID=A0ABM9AF77_9GAMM|nr:glutamate--cysteine ligase [Sinobacterium norvegicum]CAH0991857.1 Glutamate--cysteine ligase [Sinobacterium norvegicum]